MINKRQARIILGISAVLFTMLACGSSSDGTPRSIGEMTIIVPTQAQVESTSAPGEVKIYMANDENGNNETYSFVPADTVYVFIDATSYSAGAKFHVKWLAANIDGYKPDEVLTENDLEFDGKSDSVKAWIGSKSGLPLGDYRVEVYVDGAKIGEAKFNVAQ